MQRHSQLARFVSVASVPTLLVAALGTQGPASASPRAAGSSCSACGRNLVNNPGAEASKGTNSDSVVPVPGWKGTGGFTAAQYSWSGGDLSSTTPGPKNRGKNYFYGGPNAARSTGAQHLRLPAGSYPQGTTFVLRGWLGGYSSQNDNATLYVSFLNSKGVKLGSASIGPVSEAQRKGTTGLYLRTASGAVPAGTAQVAPSLVMVRTDGSDNDGMADNLSLLLSPPQK